jgi:hypothetical protein
VDTDGDVRNICRGHSAGVDTDGDVRNIEGRVQGWIQMVMYGI